MKITLVTKKVTITLCNDAVGDDAICQPVGDKEGNDAAGDDAICQPETVYNNSCHKEGDDDAVGLVNNRSKLKLRGERLWY